MKILPLCLLLLLIFPGGARNAFAERTDAYHWNRLIGRGVNLGNAFEAPNEGDWGVTLKKEYFGQIAKAGFQSVRIPVRWSAHIAESAPFEIDKAFFVRLDRVVNQALSNKLVTIVNLHHYYGLFEKPAANKARFLSIWKQLAEHYRDFPETVFFEILNEPHGELKPELWNQYLKEALEVIRRSNPNRAVIIGATQWNSISQLKNLKLPDADRNIIVTFHYYEPFQFTHQGTEWNAQSRAWLGTKWTGSDEGKAAIRTHFDEALAWGKEHNRPVFLGEFGAYNKAGTASRVRWMAFVKAEAEKRHFSWAYWEFCAGFGLYDPNTKKWRKSLLKAFFPAEN